MPFVIIFPIIIDAVYEIIEQDFLLFFFYLLFITYKRRIQYDKIEFSQILMIKGCLPKYESNSENDIYHYEI